MKNNFDNCCFIVISKDGAAVKIGRFQIKSKVLNLIYTNIWLSHIKVSKTSVEIYLH